LVLSSIVPSSEELESIIGSILRLVVSTRAVPERRWWSAARSDWLSRHASATRESRDRNALHDTRVFHHFKPPILYYSHDSHENRIPMAEVSQTSSCECITPSYQPSRRRYWVWAGLVTLQGWEKGRRKGRKEEVSS
jgi:hypothetical protein